MTESLNAKKPHWWNGFRDANTGAEIPGWDVDPRILMRENGIPRSLLDPNLQDMTPVNEKQLLVMQGMWDMIYKQNAPRTMIVSGGNGTGKSYLGAAFVHTLVLLSSCSTERDWHPLFIDEPSLLTKASGYGYYGESGFRELTNGHGLLVIDEFAMVQWTPADKRKIEQILNVRYGNRLRTVILTNRTPTELYGQTGGPDGILSPQIRSRYRNGFNIILNGHDLRPEYDYADDPF